jgi:hypothetical protein
MKIEAIRSSGTSGHPSSTRRHIPEDGILHVSIYLKNKSKEVYGPLIRHLACKYPVSLEASFYLGELRFVVVPCSFITSS